MPAPDPMVTLPSAETLIDPDDKRLEIEMSFVKATIFPEFTALSPIKPEVIEPLVRTRLEPPTPLAKLKALILPLAIFPLKIILSPIAPLVIWPEDPVDCQNVPL